MPAFKFTTSNILTAPIGKHTDQHRDGIGLTLWVRPNGSRTYLYRWQRDGVPAQVTIGTIQRITLDAARIEMRRLRGIVDAGGNPKSTRSASDLTFKDDVTAYTKWRADWSAQTKKDFIASFERHVYPQIGERRTETLRPADLVTVLAPIWEQETGRRMAQRLQAVIDHAIAADDDKRFETFVNPARGIMVRLPRTQLIREHRQAMAYDTVPSLYQRLADDDSMASYALRFLIATCAPRAAEVFAMRWGEVKGAVWNVPAGREGRMKKKVATRTVRDIPLSSEALAILDAIRPDIVDPNAFVFVGDGAGGRIGIHAMRHVLRGMDIEDDVHGFRTSFKSWGLAHMEHPLDKDAIEVAHDRAIGGAVAEVYRDTTLIGHRRILAERWACYLHGRTYTGPVAAPLLRLAA